jgi:hypothetical protein
MELVTQLCIAYSRTGSSRAKFRGSAYILARGAVILAFLVMIDSAQAGIDSLW